MNERQSERILFMRLGGVSFGARQGQTKLELDIPWLGGGLNILSGLKKVHKKSERFQRVMEVVTK